MKVFAHHDAKGALRALVTVEGPNDAGMMLAPQADATVTEIEGLTLKSRGEAALEELVEIARTHALKTPPGRGTLINRG